MNRYNTLLYETSGGVGRLTLNRPKVLNAVNAEMRAELDDFWAKRAGDRETQVIVLSGAGDKGFCSGLDLEEAVRLGLDYDLAGFYRMQSDWAQMLVAMRRAPQPIVAAVHGAAAGAGLSLALACDLRLITPRARFIASYINIGFGGSDLGSSYFLPRLIGAGRAYEFLLTGDPMDAETADRLGLVSRVVERPELEAACLGAAERMVRKNPFGLYLTKQAINMNLDAAGLEQALVMENRNQALCFGTIKYEGQDMDTT
jgi:enoyl-CoA hydratase/carnithine racemase